MNYTEKHGNQAAERLTSDRRDDTRMQEMKGKIRLKKLHVHVLPNGQT
jgi:hypothetical protein